MSYLSKLLIFDIIAPRQHGIPLEVKLAEFRKNHPKPKARMIYSFELKNNPNRSTITSKKHLTTTNDEIATSDDPIKKPLQTVFKVISKILNSTKDDT